MFALVDCNNFYASCQRVFNPKLIGKPIVVLSNNDGCVIARSNEAKALGIPMGAPAFEYQKLFEEKEVHVFSTNFALYGDMSSRVMNMLSTFSPDIEIYSIDEAFLQFKGFNNFDLQEIGLKMRKTVTKGTGIPISIGIAPTKGLGKIANKIAKKFPEETGSAYIIDSEEKRIKALRWTKIEDVWGIGRRHAKRLYSLGIKTAYQFTELPDEWVKNKMSIVGLRLKRELQGESVLELEITPKKKMIATTRSFDNMLTTLEDMQERIATYAVLGAEKLRREEGHCCMVNVFIQTNKFREDQPQYYRNIIIANEYPTDSSIDIMKMALKGLSAIYREGYHYKKAGVIIMGISPNEQTQLSLFNNENPKHAPLMSTIDKMNQSYGTQKIKFGSQALDRVWKMRQEKLSPFYTTKIKDVIKVKV